MKNLQDYEEDIYKCSRCGLCQSVCPVFKATLNECAVSRGKFNILNGIIKKELNFNKTVKKYLDLCTGCNACKEFCPSKIDVKKIFIAAKAEYYKKNKISVLEKIINSYTLFKIGLQFGRIFFSIYRFIGLPRILKYFEKVICKTGILGKRILLLNSLAHGRYKNKLAKSKHKTQKSVYFEGCFNKYINKETEEAVKTILSGSNIELIKKNFECCGVSYLNDGNIDAFNKLLNKNLEMLKDDFDFVLTDCASCNDVLKNYKLFSNKETAKKLAEKTIMVSDLLKDFNFTANKKYKVAVHKPCHDTYDFIDIVKNINGIEYIEAKDFDKCCGFSGKFALQNQEISRKISKQKAQSYLDAKVDFILTTCPACQLGLNQGITEILAENTKEKIPEVMNLFLFLAKYCKTV